MAKRVVTGLKWKRLWSYFSEVELKLNEIVKYVQLVAVEADSVQD